MNIARARGRHTQVLSNLEQFRRFSAIFRRFSGDFRGVERLTWHFDFQIKSGIAIPLLIVFGSHLDFLKLSIEVVLNLRSYSI